MASIQSVLVPHQHALGLRAQTVCTGIFTLALAAGLCAPLQARPFVPPTVERSQQPPADSLWSQIQSMESGPPRTGATTPQEAAAQTRAHIKRHIRLLEDFIAAYPRDPRQFPARLRRGALMASLATLDGDAALLERAEALLSDLERTPGLTREREADAAFHRISVLFLRARGQEARFADRIVHAAVNFHSRFPSDRRSPRLFVEAASIPELPPATRRELLEAALQRTSEEPIRRRAKDSLRQLDLLGQPLEFQMPLLGGGTFTLGQKRGRVVALAFWSAASPQSLLWLSRLINSAENLPANAELLFVSVDSDPALVRQAARDLGLTQPIAFSSKGWEHPALREIGINAVPSLWVIDKKGLVRSQNPRINLPELTRQLAAER